MSSFVVLILIVLVSAISAQLFGSSPSANARMQPSTLGEQQSLDTSSFHLQRDLSLLHAGPDDEENYDEENYDENILFNDAPMCPVSLSNAFELIRSINNYRLTHQLYAINISRSLMSTACSHQRDLAALPEVITPQCSVHSWSSCCYPADHSNPNCMHRKGLQVTTALHWNLYNVATYELSYEWTGGPTSFSTIRAVDMFVQNAGHKEFLLQEGSWANYSWKAIGATVGDKVAFIWFGTLADPNGDFDQFAVDEHVMELPGCICDQGNSPMWMPPPTLSPAQVQDEKRRQELLATDPWYTIQESSQLDELEKKANSTEASMVKKKKLDDSPCPTSVTRQGRRAAPGSHF